MFAPSAKTKVKEIEAILNVKKRIGELEESLIKTRNSKIAEITPSDSLTDTTIAANSPETVKEIHSESEKDTMAILNDLAEEMYSYGELLAFHFDQPDTGIRIFEKLIDEMPVSPRRAQAMFSLVNLYQQTGFPDTAQTYAKLLVSEYPLTEYAEKVSVSLGLDLHDKAEDILVEAERISQDNPEEALTIYQIIIDQYSYSRFVPLALMAMASTYDYELNDLENSLSLYERLVKEFPKSEQAKFIEVRYRQLKELKTSMSDTLNSEVSNVSEGVSEGED